MGKHVSQHLLNYEHSGTIQSEYYSIGFSHFDYDKMLRLQGYKCACCGSEQATAAGSIRFCVDHDHDTGKVRGLLCAACNHGIGHLGDNIEGISNALRYLRRAETSPNIRDVPESKIPPRRKFPVHVVVRLRKRDQKYVAQYVHPVTLERIERNLMVETAEEAEAIGKRIEKMLNEGDAKSYSDLRAWLRSTGVVRESADTICAG